MPQCKAKQLFEYAGRMHAPGTVLEVEDRFVRVLVALGRIEPPEAPPAPAGAPQESPPQTYRTRELVAEKPAAAPARRQRASIVAEARAAKRANA